MRSFLLLLIVLLGSCTSTRKQLERASAYEREGMLQQAFDHYAWLYGRRPNAVEAHIGMKRTSQGLFDRLQDKAMADYALSEFEAGERSRQEAIEFKNRMVVLDLEWSPLFDQRRNEAIRAEADRLYEAAEEAFRADRFTEAEALAIQCSKLDPERRDADHLQKLAQVEPIFREGARAQELGLWREAYRKFDRVSSIDPAHKDVMQRLAQCRDSAAYTIAYVPIYNKGLYTDMLSLQTAAGPIEAQLAANIKQEVLDLNDPLIILVDRDNTEQVLAEQRRAMSGVYDDRYVAEAGKLLGARYVLTARILRFDDVLRKEIEVQVQLLDAETGRIHIAEIVRVNKQEIGRGAPRVQLLERAAKRTALKLAEFDPTKG